MAASIQDLFGLVRGFRRPPLRPTPPFAGDEEEAAPPPLFPRPRINVTPPVSAPTAGPALAPPSPVVQEAAMFKDRLANSESMIPPLSAPLGTQVDEYDIRAVPDVSPSVAPVVPPLRKPVRAETGDPLADEMAYARQIGTYKPVNDNSRLKSIGIGALRGLAQGGLMGGIFGAAGHAIDPSQDEQYHWRREGQRSQGQLGQMFGQRKAALDMEKDAADIEKTRAEIVALGRPKPREPKLFQGADGLQYEYDPETKTAAAISGQGGKVIGAKPLNTVVRGKKVWYETPEGLKPAIDPATGAQLTDEDELVEVNLGGQKFRLPEREAARIFGDIEAANVAWGNKFGEQSYEDQVRAGERQRKDWESLRDRYAQATQVLAKFEAAKDAIQKVDQYGTPVSTLGEARGIANALKAAYPDLVEDVGEANGYPYVKLKPLPPAPQISEPQRRAPALRARPQVAPLRRPTGSRPQSDPLGLYN